MGAGATPRPSWNQDLAACDSDVELLHHVVGLHHQPLWLPWLSHAAGSDLSGELMSCSAECMPETGWRETRDANKWAYINLMIHANIVDFSCHVIT